ncbi:hypothetical protein [uncultured Ruegeria sp.]|uniref:phosphorylase family protein n=1 Tax=uncultured Ruegeria sp. TaxID=259304 RepID=UPI0026045CDA|nr:hypothetical protein [uncultured Ruegeria sp.]
MAILNYDAQHWRDALGIAEGCEPTALILEGTWWRETATQARLSKLNNVAELAFPEMFVGDSNGVRIAYCCAYGAARAVEPAHVFGQLGTKLMIQLGTCGSLDPNAGTGVVALPVECQACDGVSQYYGAGEKVMTDPDLVSAAERALSQRGIPSQRTRHLTWPSLFAQSDEMCAEWAREGIASIDMETSAVVAVGDRFGARTFSLLTVWDQLFEGRTFNDPLPPESAEALKRSNDAVFDVALEIALGAAGR